MVYPYSGILFNHKRADSDTYYNTDDPKKHAKCNKPGTKKQILF